MYKVVIVEDDRIIRRALVQSDWESIGMTVVGEAPDGQRGLEVIRENQPQVVVTDINMPFMDGIQMAREVRRELPFTRILFLTGFDDFQYVREAMLLKADDYLLKPVQMPVLLEKAQAALEAWEEDRQRQELLSESLPLLQENFLSRIIFDSSDRTPLDMQKELFRLGVFLTGPLFAVMHVRVPVPAADEAQKLADRLAGWPKPGEGEILSFRDNEVFLFLSLDHADSGVLEEWRLELEEYLLAEWDLPTAITVSSLYDDMQGLETAVLETKVAMEQLHVTGNTDLLDQLGEEVRRHLQLGEPAQMRESIHAFYENLIQFALELRAIKRMALKHVLYIGTEINSWAMEEADLLNLSNVHHRILKAGDESEILAIIDSLLEHWEGLLREQKETPKETITDKAVQFLQEHYADPDITLVRLAEEVHVTAPYLSNLFKLEKRMNFTDYLLQLRMEKAKELLAATDMKTYEVAEAVGYMNPHYFSNCFKKYTGQTPMHYRKRQAPQMNAGN